jgi:hypothetical protein
MVSAGTEPSRQRAQRRQPRSQRGAVEDRWRKRDGTPSAVDGEVTRWRARYVDDAGNEHTVTDLIRFWAPKIAQTTVDAWCDTWIAGYRTRRKSTVRQAEVHLRLIKKAFGEMPLSSLKPSRVKAWTSQLKVEGRADSYVYALHSRLSQIMSDAVHDGFVVRNPCSRRTSPGNRSQRPYVATTAQVWALHDAVPAGIGPATCSVRSSGCGSPRRPRCDRRTSTSCAASCHRRSSGRRTH